MIVAVSIVDKHKKPGERHVGTYMFEIPYDAHSHFDFAVVTCQPEAEEKMRPYCGQLLTVETIPNPVHLDGKPVEKRTPFPPLLALSQISKGTKKNAKHGKRS